MTQTVSGNRLEPRVRELLAQWLQRQFSEIAAKRVRSQHTAAGTNKKQIPLIFNPPLNNFPDHWVHGYRTAVTTFRGSFARRVEGLVSDVQKRFLEVYIETRQLCKLSKS